MTLKNKRTIVILSIIFLLLPNNLAPFGFHAHRIINRKAVFTLPPELLPLYRKHIEYITERSIDPDRRAHAIPNEAPRHYIDIDYYGDNPFEIVPRDWEEAEKKFSKDTLIKYGVIPWHINEVMNRLTNAFKSKNIDMILYNSAHIGHYIADACTPLHTTLYYNGRTDKQKGIHALWESRLPELFADNYDYFVGRAEYIESPLDKAWELIKISHKKVEDIFLIYDKLYNNMPSDLIYSHEMRGQSYTRPYSGDFSEAFHENMNGMVEKQMRLAVKTVGSYWYTAWINAGQPDLMKLVEKEVSDKHKKELKSKKDKWKKKSNIKQNR